MLHCAEVSKQYMAINTSVVILCTPVHSLSGWQRERQRISLMARLTNGTDFLKEKKK
jgi:hypothetical protein